MALRDILVHLDASERAGERLRLAADLARRQGAHLTGLYVIDIQLPALVAGDAGGGLALAQVLEQMRQEALDDAAKIRAGFEERLRLDGIAGEWRQAEGVPASVVAQHARLADLVVLGQEDPITPVGDAGAVIQAALFTSGRPVLVIPSAGRFESLGRKVLIGWNGSREAARAVNDALPLLVTAERAAVLVINPARIEGEAEAPGAGIARHLARHDVRVEVQHIVNPEIGEGDSLLNTAAEQLADLLVIGAYGHSRFRELVLGGATRTLLRQMTLPVLLSH